jgi:hypothetical protein
MIEVSGRGFGGKLFAKGFPQILLFECAVVSDHFAVKKVTYTR